MTVYFHIQSNDRVKIGHTTQDVEDRKRNLQTGSGHPLMCLGVLIGDRALEQQLHYVFAPYKIQDTGEWYWAVPPILDFIDRFAIKPENLCGEDGKPERRDYRSSLPNLSVILQAPRATAILFLKKLFEPGGPPIMGNEVLRRAEDCGIRPTTLYRARNDLNIDARSSERYGGSGPLPWYPPKEWPHIPGLETFSEAIEDEEQADVAANE